MNSANQKQSVVSILLLTFIFCVVLWPFYIDIRLAPNVGINPQRILAAIFAFFFIISLIKNSTQRYVLKQYVRGHRLFYFMFFGYFSWRLLSALVVETPVAIFMALYEVVVYLLVYFGFLVCVFFKNRRQKLLSVIAVATFILIVFCYLEALVGSNPLAAYATRTDRLAISAGEILRDGEHRIKGTFEHPLTLVQYVALVLPFLVVASIGVYKFYLRAFFLCALVVVAALTRSRSALAFLGAIYIVYLWAKFMTSGKSQKLLRFSFILMIVAFMSLAFVALSSTDSDLYGKSLLESNAREAQLFNGAIAIMQSPLFGYGPGIGAGEVVFDVSQQDSGAMQMWESNASTVDNRYLSIAIESGIPALLFFVAFNFLALRRAFYELLISGRVLGRTLEWYWLLASIMSCLGALVVMLILSIFTVHSVFFMALASLAYSTEYLYKQRRSRGHLNISLSQRSLTAM